MTSDQHTRVHLLGDSWVNIILAFPEVILQHEGSNLKHSDPGKTTHIPCELDEVASLKKLEKNKKSLILLFKTIILFAAFSQNKIVRKKMNSLRYSSLNNTDDSAEWGKQSREDLFCCYSRFYPRKKKSLEEFVQMAS